MQKLRNGSIREKCWVHYYVAAMALRQVHWAWLKNNLSRWRFRIGQATRYTTPILGSYRAYQRAFSPEINLTIAFKQKVQVLNIKHTVEPKIVYLVFNPAPLS